MLKVALYNLTFTLHSKFALCDFSAHSFLRMRTAEDAIASAQYVSYSAVECNYLY